MRYGDFVQGLFKDEGNITPWQFGIIHAAVGVADEASEVLGEVKKHVFTGKELNREAVVSELGDVEFYLEALRQQLGINRAETLVSNMSKLSARHRSGKVEDYYEAQ